MFGRLVLTRAFFARFGNDDGSLKGGINEYATPSEFTNLVAIVLPGARKVLVFRWRSR
jgi:hypothetical protein